MSEKADFIREYISDITTLPKEEPRKIRFTVLLASLFGEKLATKVIKGTEKLVRLQRKGKPGKGFIDAYYGDAVIEFEANLDKMREEAQRQLKEYIAGLWEKKGQPFPLNGIATDGLKWELYYPLRAENATRPWNSEHIELKLVESRVVKPEQAEDFYFWMSRLFLRDSLLTPTVQSFEEDFGLKSTAFNDAFLVLAEAFDKLSQDSEPKLAFETWAKYLRYSYGKFEANKDLFVIHTYLAAVARLLVWGVFSKGKSAGSLKETIRRVFNGSYFQTWRLENLVEKDFYYWILNSKVENQLTPLWTRIINQILTYDLSQVNQDILKGIYQQLVDEITRHGLGEYYTPEWLCERIVEDLLPQEGIVKVLDPSCGSGSFLRATLAHFLKRNPNLEPSEKLNTLLESVVGFDINPLAVLISKATYSIALRDLIKDATRSVQIPVYLADTLFVPKEIKQHRLALKAVPMYEIEFGNKRVELPEILVTNSRDFDIAISCCTKVALDLAAPRSSESKNTLKNFLLNENPSLATDVDFDSILDGLWDFTEKLADLIRKGKNSIWGYILRNSYRPSMLVGKFDVIVGNPPWLSYRYIEDPKYQEEIKRLGVEKYKVAPKKQKLMTQMEIATIFLLHSISTFGTKDSSKIGFVMPRGVFNSDQHEVFRIEGFSADVEVVKYWDLRDVQPLFNVPACVVFLQRKRERSPRFEYPVVEYSGNLPGPDLSWVKASQHLNKSDGNLRLIYLGNHTALSTQNGWTKPTNPSSYSKRFHQGATIVPRNVYFIDFVEEVKKIDPQKLYSVKTDEEQAKDSKPPYDKVRLQGQIEGRFIGYAALSKHVLPFVVLPPSHVTLPISKGDGGYYEILPTKELNSKGFRYAAKWYAKAEQIWNELRGQKADSQDLYNRLDYQRELTTQSWRSTNIILYNAAGTHLAAAHLDLRSLDSWCVVEHKLYWFPCKSPEEGYYLTAILNSLVADEMIKPFQTLGLLGERDIEKKILELPIPVFSRNNSIHLELAELGKEATKKANRIVLDLPETRSLGMKRKAVREALGEIIQNINLRVSKILK